jgi:2-iminobutanoate/2-iminopropanoate deaminase
MKMIVRNPAAEIYAATDDYVHAMEVEGARRLLFVSGTMGLDEAGRAPATLEAQLEAVWMNIRRILADARMTTDNIVRLTSYLQDAACAEANQNAHVAALGSRRVPTTAVVVGLLSSDWLVEIEIVAAG